MGTADGISQLGRLSRDIFMMDSNILNKNYMIFICTLFSRKISSKYNITISSPGRPECISLGTYSD